MKKAACAIRAATSPEICRLDALQQWSFLLVTCGANKIQLLERSFCRLSTVFFNNLILYLACFLCGNPVNKTNCL